MKKIITFVNIIFLVLTVSVNAGYDEMRDEYESYRPSSYFESQLRPEKDYSPIQVEDEFQKEIARLLESRSKWEKAIDEKETFSIADPEFIASVSIAASDVKTSVDALQKGFSKEMLEALVLLRNPSITSAEKKLRASIEKISQVANLDEILRQYNSFTKDAMTGVGSMKGNDSVAMRFPFPGVMALKGQVVEKEVEVAKMDLEIARRDAVTSIRKAYWNLLFFRKALEITKEILALLTYLEEVATTRYESGKTSYQDVVKVRINREILEENLKTLKERQKNIEIGILALLNLPGDTRMGKPIQSKLVVTVPDLEKLFDLAKENRQEIRRLHAKIGKMERMVELAETMIFPSYSLNLSLNENDAVKSVGTFNQKETFPVSTTASRGAGLPKKSWYGSNDAYLRQTRQKIEALKANLKSLEDKTTVLVRNAWFNLDRSKREGALFANTVVELSKTTLEVSTRGYESGNVMFADVYASYDAWFKANLTLERKRNDIGIFWAELERVVGKRISHSKN